MKFDKLLETIGNNSPLEEAKKSNDPNYFEVPNKYKALYEELEENGVDILPNGPLDVYKILEEKMITPNGESNLSPNMQRVRQALGYAIADKTIPRLTGWDGGVITRPVVNKFGELAGDRWLSVKNGKSDVFQDFPWTSVLEYAKTYLEKDPNLQQHFEERLAAGHKDKLPTARGVLDNGSVGPTLAEFVMFLAMQRFQKNYMVDKQKITREGYLNKLKRKKLFNLEDIESTKADIDAIQSDSEAIDSDVGFRGAYTD